MGIRHDLQRSIDHLLQSARVGSYETQDARKKILHLFAKDLVTLGYGLRHINGLQQKHIQAVVTSWINNKIQNATLKNRASALRFLCKCINKPTIIKSNEAMGIGKRTYLPTKNKAIHNPDFSKVTDLSIHISLQLQRVFGLRREESLKIKPHLADKGQQLELLSSWCKGGRGRTIPIYTEEQRYWLEEAKKQAGEFGHSLIPENKSYIHQRDLYDKQVQRAGLRNLHGLRHAYAQNRYKELTGWNAPIAGGPRLREMTPEQKQIDHQARMILSETLGHSRKFITSNYLGN
ncbi:MAG: integrase [Gammaproteobacteria bacterium]|jgi:site-specific recombinase XerC|nr:integrase [Gammaproteobacteria bacterium]